MRSLLVLLLPAAAVGLQLPAAIAASSTSPRAASPLMKGRGTRGMPGKDQKQKQRGSASGFTSAMKKRLDRRDFERSEWTLVAEKDDLGTEVGSAKAVEAGQTPQGTNYIWTLFRGKSEGNESTVYATDGSCRSCTAPLFSATMGYEDDEPVMTCGACGSKFSLEDGRVLSWLPGEGPVQWMAAQLNKDKEQVAAGMLQTRVSQAGRIYVRLPDGTLAITKSAADRASELAGTGEGSTMEQVKAAQEKASARQ